MAYLMSWNSRKGSLKVDLEPQVTLLRVFKPVGRTWLMCEEQKRTVKEKIKQSKTGKNRGIEPEHKNAKTQVVQTPVGG